MSPGPDLCGMASEMPGADVAAEVVMRTMVERACQATRAAAAVLDSVQGETLYMVGSGLLRGADLARCGVSDTLVGLAVRTSQVQLSTDTAADDRVDRGRCRRAQVRSIVVVPLVHEGWSVGALQVFSSQPHCFDGNDVYVLEQWAPFIATALHRATFLAGTTSAHATGSSTE